MMIDDDDDDDDDDGKIVGTIKSNKWFISGKVQGYSPLVRRSANRKVR